MKKKMIDMFVVISFWFVLFGFISCFGYFVYRYCDRDLVQAQEWYIENFENQDCEDWDDRIYINELVE